MKRALGLMLVVTSLVAIAVTAGAATAAPAKKQDTSLSGGGQLVRLPARLEVDPGAGIGVRVQRLLLADRLRWRDRGDHRQDGRLRSNGRAAHEGSVRPPARAASRFRGRFRRPPMMYNLPGLNCILRLNGKRSRRHLPRQHHEVERPEDRSRRTASATCPTRRSRRSTAPTTRARRTTSPTTSSAVSPTWKSKLGVGVNAQWPAGVGASGSSGVAGVLAKTEGAIGYADVAYALKNKIRFASILNASGKYATPGLRGIKAAAATLPKKITSDGCALDREPARRGTRSPTRSRRSRTWSRPRARRRRRSCAR